MAEDLMRYDQLTQLALRSVVREALRKVQRSGLPGEHHFYIAFNTKYPGVILSDRIAERYPREMTVVLQHQFWNLIVTDDRFEVELSFDNIPEKLVIPFNSLKGFLDPSVQIGFQFEVVPVEEQEQPDSKTSSDRVPNASDQPEGAASEQGDGDDGDTQAKVVSLDAFRKK